jgi:hypothetical protein
MAKKFPFSLLFIFIIIPLLWGCEQFPSDSDDPVLARVGNERLTLQRAVESIPADILRQDSVEAIKQYQSTWVEQQVLENEARRIGLNNNRDFQQRVERLKSQLLQSALRDAIINQHRDELEVSIEDAQNYYQANKDRFILDERYVRFRHMTTRTRVEADNAQRDIMRGNSWQDVANRYSINPELQIRESERFVPISMAASDVPRMNRFLNQIGITEISPIQQYGGNFHFVQLMEERPEGDHPDLDWLIEQITQWLYLERSKRVINSYKRNLYLQAEANNEIDKMNVEDFDESLIINVLQQANN